MGEDLVERVAYAICMSAGCVWDEDPKLPSRAEWRANARTAIAIVVEACAVECEAFAHKARDPNVARFFGEARVNEAAATADALATAIRALSKDQADA